MTIKLYHKNKNGIFSINICFANPFCFLQNLPSTKQTKLSLNINIHPSSNSDLSLCLENYVHAHFLEDKFTCNMKVSVILHPHCSILLFFAAVNVIIVTSSSSSLSRKSPLIFLVLICSWIRSLMAVPWKKIKNK